MWGKITSRPEYLLNLLYETELFPLLKAEGINHCLVDNTLWLRDFILCKGDGTQMLHKEELCDNETLFNLFDECEDNENSSESNNDTTDEEDDQNSLDNEELDFMTCIAKLDPTNYFSRTWPSGFICSLGGATANNRYPDVRKALLSYCETNQINHVLLTALMEGGNIITLEKDNRIFTLIGKSSRIITACYRLTENITSFDHANMLQAKFLVKKTANNFQFYQSVENMNQPFHTGHLKEARYAIESILNLPRNQIIWLPQADFHLDGLISIGPKCLFLNNHKMVADIAEKDFQQTHSPFSKQVFKTASMHHRLIGDILLAIKTKLKRKGFKVIEVPGLAFAIDNEDEENGQSFRLITNFMNAITGFGRNGYFHIALSSPIKALEVEFIKILKENGVDNVHLIGEPDIVERILENDGSLRCLSTPGTDFGSLNNTSAEIIKLPIIQKEYEIVYTQNKNVNWSPTYFSRNPSPSDSSMQKHEIENDSEVEELQRLFSKLTIHN